MYFNNDDLPGKITDVCESEVDSTPEYYKAKDGSGITCDMAASAMMGKQVILSNGVPREGAKDIFISCACIAWRWSALKYLWRFDQKGGKKDLDKCIDCLKRLREGIYGKEQAR